MSKNKILEELLKEVDKHPEIMSRRDALKFMSISPLAASVIAGTTVGTSDVIAADVKGKIVIVGGGLAGISTAARLKNSIKDADITVIEPNPISVSYQPGLTLVAAGIWEPSEIEFKRDDFLPRGVKLIKGSVTAFDPKNNSLTVDNKTEVTYDQMVIATGLMLNFGAIKGLNGSITSFSPSDDVKDSGIGKDGLHSIFFQDGATATWTGLEELIEKAKNHTSIKKLQALFTHPDTPIKCGGAPKKIMYLVDARLKEAGVRDKVELIFYPNSGALFSIKDYDDALTKQFEKRDFKWHFKHNLIEVDTATKTAVFDKHYEVQGEYDEDLEEYMTETQHERVEVHYDFMHVTPPMKAPDVVGNSDVGSAKGWVPVNQETLQHVKFDNVWCLGDVAAIPLAKTGGSVRKQYKVLVDNMIASMQSKELTSAYDGYTVCPFITGVGTVMLAEFNWKSQELGSGDNAAFLPLDSTKERWIWWLLKVYILKPMTMHGMLSGRV